MKFSFFICIIEEIPTFSQYLCLFCQFDAAKLRKLRPSFKQVGGSVTAGNASIIRFLPSHVLLDT